MPVNTLPYLTNVLDNAFTETWFDMQAQATDQILLSTPIWALLKLKGCFKSQEGSTKIERTIKYDTGFTPTAVGKGSILPSGEKQTRTSAFWNYERAIATHIQRDLMDDADNAGPYKIVDYVTERTQEAMDALKQKYEGDLFRAHDPTEGLNAVPGANAQFEMQGLCDLVPPPATRSTGTYGNIARCSNYVTNVGQGITTADFPDLKGGTAVNPWWSARYKQFSLPIEVNIVTDMNNMYNVVTDQMEAPDMIITSQNLFETYTNFGLDAIQYVGNQKMMDLGFDSVMFKGKDLTWTRSMSAGATLFDGTTAGYAGLNNAMLFLNSSYVECVYNPILWFQMTPWKDYPTSTARIAHIICRVTIVSKQLRRHGLIYN